MAATVGTAGGLVSGVNESGVLAYKGIPYAAAPVGERRFRPPERREAWDGVLDCSEFGPVPFQPRMPGVFGDLATPIQPQGHDSLRLNVWTPDVGSARLPVLVWIHGGAFFAGSGSDSVYSGARFARDGVVTVTINYRLGVEGFLHLGEHFPGFDDSGCNGIADQLAALQWVQENIAAFGGDQARVTIAGESAGGMSVSTLLAAPAARGLFQGAIPQSGAGHNGISAPTASSIAAHFLERAGIRPGDVESLQNAPIERLLEVQEAMQNELGATRDASIYGEAASSAMPFQPTYGTSFLPSRPIDAVAEGSARDVQLLVGTNAEEAVIFIKALSDIFNEPLVRATLQMVMAPAGRDGDRAFEAYAANRPGAPPYEIAAATETDRMFRLPAIRLAEAQAAHNPRVHMYRFDWRSNAFDGEMGAFHFLEVPFVFDNLDDPVSRAFTGKAPQSVADSVHGAWVAFATTGQPGHAGLPEWPRYDTASRSTMLFGDVCKTVQDPSADERELWTGVL
jgi:para-nitrobenzyl esterase